MLIMRREQGFTLVWALFLVVIGALISIYMVRMSSVQSGTNDLAIHGSRAYQAARAGSEWGIHEASNGNCAASTNFSLIEADLNGFTVTVTCSLSVHTENGTPRNLYDILSAASIGVYGTSPDYAYRQVQVTVAK